MGKADRGSGVYGCGGKGCSEFYFESGWGTSVNWWQNGLTNEGKGCEGTVSKSYWMVWKLVGVFAREGFDEGSVFGGILLEG